jgi:hypothetical protein
VPLAGPQLPLPLCQRHILLTQHAQLLSLLLLAWWLLLLLVEGLQRVQGATRSTLLLLLLLCPSLLLPLAPPTLCAARNPLGCRLLRRPPPLQLLLALLWGRCDTRLCPMSHKRPLLPLLQPLGQGQL